jgi:hypothetical protein
MLSLYYIVLVVVAAVGPQVLEVDSSGLSKVHAALVALATGKEAAASLTGLAA